jgi:hypothetical protein
MNGDSMEILLSSAFPLRCQAVGVWVLGGARRLFDGPVFLEA